MSEISSLEEFDDPNEIKVVVDKFGNAIYFSREPIPSRKKSTSNSIMLKQVCIIPFKRDYLLKFNATSETNLEITESIDMMRIIENGEQVRMVMTNENSFSVDTKVDLDKVQKIMSNDKLLNLYNK
jgi:3-deoxy-manno-octulosonate cytidylyltransferase (CMP-KDO synthetase)